MDLCRSEYCIRVAIKEMDEASPLGPWNMTVCNIITLYPNRGKYGPGLSSIHFKSQSQSWGSF